MDAPPFDPGSPVIIGSGPPLVIVHGLGASKRIVAEIFAPHLAEHYTLIGFDLPGHGALGEKAYKPVFEPNDPIGEFAERLAAALQRLGLTSFALCGLSFGALVALEVAARHPQRIRALVLQGAPCWRHPEARYLRIAVRVLGFLYRLVPHRLSRAVIEGIRRIAQRLHGPLPPQMDAIEQESRSLLNHDLWMECIVSATRYDPHRAFRSIRCPLLIVDGADTEAYFPGTAPKHIAHCASEEGADVILVAIPGAGHTVTMLRPQEFTTAIHAFLATHP